LPHYKDAHAHYPQNKTPATPTNPTPFTGAGRMGLPENHHPRHIRTYHRLVGSSGLDSVSAVNIQYQKPPP